MLHQQQNVPWRSRTTQEGTPNVSQIAQPHSKIQSKHGSHFVLPSPINGCIIAALPKFYEIKAEDLPPFGKKNTEN